MLIILLEVLLHLVFDVGERRRLCCLSCALRCSWLTSRRRALEEPQNLRKSETGFQGEEHDIGDHTAFLFFLGRLQEFFVYQKILYYWLLFKVMRAQLNSC